MVTRSPRDLPRLALAGGVLLALACGHTEPFGTPSNGTAQPFDSTPPLRLTLNQGPDRGASWLPDGTGILYSAQQLLRPDFDVCLAELPATGGTQLRLECDPARLDADVTNATESPVASAAGRLAFVRARGSVGGPNPAFEAISVAPRLDLTAASDVQRIPYTLPGEAQQSAATALRWLGEDRLVYVGGAVTYRQACGQCALDTIATGRKVALLDLAPTPAAAVLPGTDFASGVSPGASADEVYYTLGGDSRVYRRVLSSGEVTVAHDFGAAGIARDVHVAGGRLAATVGGRVTFSVDPDLGPVQWDSGGIIHVVDLASGADVALAGPGLFRRPALSPAGDRLVAEGYPLTIVRLDVPPTDPRTADTTVARSGDLYLFTTP